MSRPTNSGPWVGKVPAEGGTVFFAASEPAMASTGMMTKNRPTEHVDGAGDVPARRVAGEAGEGGAVVAGLRDVGVQRSR